MIAGRPCHEVSHGILAIEGSSHLNPGGAVGERIAVLRTRPARHTGQSSPVTSLSWDASASGGAVAGTADMAYRATTDRGQLLASMAVGQKAVVPHPRESARAGTCVRKRRTNSSAAKVMVLCRLLSA